MTAEPAGDLARAFDADFARPAMLQAPDAEDLLAIRLGDTGYALAHRDLGGVFAGKPVTHLPGGAPGLLGISGFRGSLVPVYDLAALLGAPRPDAVRWLVTAAAVPVALAFKQFERMVRVPREAIAEHAGAPMRHARRTARIGDELRPILDLASIIEAIRGAAQAHRGRSASEAAR